MIFLEIFVQKSFVGDILSLIIFAEIKDSLHPVAQKIHLALEIFDYCTLIVFVLEISLKLLDDFWAFWKNRWNIFDFGVTFFVSTICNLFGIVFRHCASTIMTIMLYLSFHRMVFIKIYY